MRSCLPLLALLGACEPEPAAPPPIEEPPALRVWEPAGLHASGELPERWHLLGAPPEQTANDLRLLLDGPDLVLVLEGQEHRRPARWTRLGPTLERCLGDPLATPPAGDPQALRLLVQDGGVLRMTLTLQGDNPCRLSGQVHLPIQGELADTGALMVDGQPWSDGGPARAKVHIRAWRRLLVQERWNELLPADRIELLEALSQDPDPEAAALLQSIIDRDPSAAADAKAALGRRPPTSENTP